MPTVAASQIGGRLVNFGPDAYINRDTGLTGSGNPAFVS
jgi:hypothetical protein